MTDAFEAIKKKLRLFLTSGLSKTKVSLCVWIKILDFKRGIDDFFRNITVGRDSGTKIKSEQSETSVKLRSVLKKKKNKTREGEASKHFHHEDLSSFFESILFNESPNLARVLFTDRLCIDAPCSLSFTGRFTLCSEETRPLSCVLTAPEAKL